MTIAEMRDELYKVAETLNRLEGVVVGRDGLRLCEEARARVFVVIGRLESTIFGQGDA